MTLADDSRSTPRPGLAIISNCLTPYRVHLHKVIAEGVPEFKLHTLITHGAADFDWKLNVPAQINLVHFGQKNDSPMAKLHHSAGKEWRKGGRLVDYLEQHDIRAAIIGLPRYMSYLRVLLDGWRRGRPVFVNSDANIQNERALGQGRQLLKSVYHQWWIRRAAGVMPMGRDGEEYFLKYGANPQRMYRLPYWPDYEHFSSVPTSRLDNFCHKYGLCKDRRYFLFSGRLAPIKRVDLLINAFQSIATDRIDWDLLIVGDGVLREELQRQVLPKYRSRVIWVGFLEDDELPAAYHAADVLVLPSDREPWAVVVQEAMAAGLPVVASDVVGAAREIVRDNIGGRSFIAKDSKSLVAAMIDVSRGKILSMEKERARTVIDRWRRENDPVDSIRRALRDFRVL